LDDCLPRQARPLVRRPHIIARCIAKFPVELAANRGGIKVRQVYFARRTGRMVRPLTRRRGSLDPPRQLGKRIVAVAEKPYESVQRRICVGNLSCSQGGINASAHHRLP
jgi:hypothetical protein